MPYIGSSRYKYSPYLTIHFGKTEKYDPGDAVPPFVGSSTFSQLPLYRQSMALHLSFEDKENSNSGTIIDHSPAVHPIYRWGQQEFTTPTCVPLGGDSCARGPGNAIRPATFFGISDNPAGIAAEGDWSRLFENDCTIEGWFLDPSSASGANGGGFSQSVAFNIGDENSDAGSQRRLFTIIATGAGGTDVQFRIGEKSGTETVLLTILGGEFEPDAYMNYYDPDQRYKKLRASNTWRYWCLEKYGNAFYLLFHTMEYKIYSLSAAHNFGAITYPSSASFSVGVHLSGYNYKIQQKSLDTLQPRLRYTGNVDEIRITPYARYKGNLSIPTGASALKFDYNDW